jgi:ankyrin repeat protein
MKYANREFIHRGLPLNYETVDIAFHEATREGNLAFMLKYLLQGANINWRDPSNHLRSALHLAVLENLHVTVEYLLLWSADCLIFDDEQLTPIHYALRQNKLQMSLVLIRRALRDNSCLDVRILVQSALVDASDMDISSLIDMLESGKLSDSPTQHRIYSNNTCVSETSILDDLEFKAKELPPLPESLAIRRLSGSTTDSVVLEHELPDMSPNSDEPHRTSLLFPPISLDDDSSSSPLEDYSSSLDSLLPLSLPLSCIAEKREEGEAT